jgi:hypothetical protein
MYTHKYEDGCVMEAARTSETLVNVYQTAWRYNPEDSHLRTHRLDNLKSYTHQVISKCDNDKLPHSKNVDRYNQE